MLDGILLKAPLQLFNNLDIVWTFILLVIRIGGMMFIIPGLGMGQRGMMIRMPATMAIAFAVASVSKVAPVPPNVVQMAILLSSEFFFGLLIGMIPFLIVSGAQMAGQLTSGTMGLSASNLIDPAQGTSATPIALLLGNMVILIFLLLGGHHVAIYVASGLGGRIPPGTLLPVQTTVELLVDRTAAIFEAGVILSAPVIVALLLTQFVMGLVTKAVPTVNIFIVSFPLTIGIGLILTGLSLPTFIYIITRDVSGIENSLRVVVDAMMKGG